MIDESGIRLLNYNVRDLRSFFYIRIFMAATVFVER